MNYRLARLATSLAFLLCTTGVASAAVTAAGPPKDVVACPTCSERSPAIAGTKAGKLLTGWEGGTTADPRGLLSRFFISPGQARGVQFPLNTPTEFLTERSLALAGTPSGGFVAAFETIDSTSDSDIWLRRYDAAGKPLGAEVQVNIEDLTLGSSDALPAVAVGLDGSILVTWISSPKPPGPFDRLQTVMARRFAANGTPVQPPFRVSTGLVDSKAPAACIDTTGRAVIGWVTVDEIRIFQASLNGVAYRRFASTGAPVDTTEKIVAKPLAQKSEVALSCGLAGSFVVAWSTDQAPAVSGQGLVAARYDQRGRRLGSVFLVAPAGQQPSLSHDTLGNFVAVWNHQEGNSSTVSGRRYLATGSADGAAFPVAESALLTTSLRNARVAHFGASKAFAVAWDSGQRNVFLRFFKAQ